MSGITHSTVVVVADDGTSPVGTDEWNAAHDVASGSFVAAKIAFSATDVVLGRATAGAGNGEEIAVTAAGRAILDDATAADQRTTLGAAAEGAIGAGFFGDGSDGAITLQQSTAAPAWAAKSGSGATTTFTLTRDVYATTFDMDDSAGNYLVRTAGWRIFASTSLVIDAGVTVHNDGNAAVADTAGGNITLIGTVGATAGAGSAGAVNTTATQATAVTVSASTTNTTATAHGGTGGAATGGGTGGGVAGGKASCPATSSGPRNIIQALTAYGEGSVVSMKGGGGGTGGNATGGTTAKGGGGGGGASTVLIAATLLTNAGTIRARGGIGGDAAIGNGTGAGGGGGGGGGSVILVYGAGSTVGTATAPGGTGGALAGTGATGGTGEGGIVYQLVLS